MRRIVWAAALAGAGVLFATAAAQPASRNCHSRHNCPPPTTATSTTSPTTTTGSGSYLFDDEFNGAAGTKPSTTLWSAKLFTNSAGNYWNGWNQVSENGNGELVITAVKNSSGVWETGEIAGNVSYSGARYVEARAEVPCGYGTWSAPIWEIGNGAPQFEDDVIEQLGRTPQTYYASNHNWTSPGVSTQKVNTVATGVTLCDGFHTYAAAVHADHVDFYFDGAKVATTLASSIGLTDLTSWHDHVMVDLAMGGKWAGTPTISGPVSLLVDYVRVTALP